MKRGMSLLFFVSMSWIFHVEGSQHQELFLQANKYYKERAYAKALEAYLSIPDKSSAVWYNSGNSSYHLGNYMEALIAFKRAYRGATHEQRQAIDYNIGLTLRALDIVPIPLSFILRIYIYIARALDSISLIWLQILFLFFLYGAFYMYRCRKYTISCIVLSILTLLFGSSVGIKYYDMQFQYGMVTKKQASIFVGPDKKFDVLGSVSLADELIILEKRPEWYKVKKGKLFGWIPAEVMSEL